MRFKKRAFALIWILLSAVLCCGLLTRFEQNNAPGSNAIIAGSQTTQKSPIDENKLAAFLVMTTLLSVSMGIFFFVYSDELAMYIGNYKRTKEI